MIHENIKIDIDYEKLGIKHKGADAVFTTYIKEMYPDYQNVFERPLVIICPGGGYEHHSPREGEAVALKMLDFGYNAVVLRYSLMPDEFPCALYEAAYTINYVRNHAKEWDINPDKIIIAGFSAGGHVAASLATMYDQPELADFIQNVLHVSPKEVRPDGLLLGYPVITSGKDAHRASFVKLLGENYEKYIDDAEQAETTEEKIKYLKKSLDEEYNTKALQEITYIITTKIQFNEEYEVYYNMVKDSFKSKDLNILNIEMYKRFADNELYNKNYDKAMEYLKKAEKLGMNIGDSHVFWEIKEIKDNERKYNSEPNKDLENKREEYLNKFSEINNEVSEFNYSGTDTQIKDTYSLVLKKWDNALNEIYNDLKNILSSTDMELLRIAQKDWVIRRDKRAEEDSKMYGSNSTEEIEYTKSLADSIKERYYELIENYLN